MKLERRGHKVEYGLLGVKSEQVEIATEFRVNFCWSLSGAIHGSESGDPMERIVLKS